MDEYPGFFLTVEGLDGSGKTTVVEALSEAFNDVVVTQEPSDLWTGEIVRDSLSSEDDPSLTTFHQFMSDRVNHIEKTIVPALEEGRLVISDRYGDSTRAYQPHQLLDDFDDIQQARWYIDSVMAPWSVVPDLTLYLEIGVDTALNRCDRGDKYETRENLEQVKDNYEWVNFQHQDRIAKIDAERSADVVAERCIERLNQEVE